MKTILPQEIRDALAKLENPLLDMYKKLGVNSSVGRTVHSFQIRDMATRDFAWAVPNLKALETLARYAPIIEMGAGRGYWAWLLRKAGVEITTYDPYPPREGNNTYAQGNTNEFVEILKGGEEALEKIEHASLFLCWAPTIYPSRTTA